MTRLIDCILPTWALLCLFLLSGCTSVAPYRNHFSTAEEEATLSAPCVKVERDASGVEREVELRAQIATERLPCYKQSIEVTKEYRLFFVEFDEQGRYHDRRQMEQLFEYLKKVRVESTRSKADCPGSGAGVGTGLSIVTFVHGWRHNARYDDEHLNLARKVLRYTYQGEQSKPHYNPADCPRDVVGIFVGWRGLSTTVTDAPRGALRSILEPWEWMSVWDRKNTAQNVAVGSVRELLGTIRAYQQTRNEDEKTRCAFKELVNAPVQAGAVHSEVFQCLAVRHLIVGHSYGALIVHNAVSQQLVESVTRGRFEVPNDVTCQVVPGDPSSGRALVQGYADLIILLNPAVEGARYEPLYEAIAQRAGRDQGADGFCPNQKPVMVVLTSLNDFATRQAFRAVRFVGTFFESNSPYNDRLTAEERAYIAAEEGRSSLRTLGHNPRYNTHELLGWKEYLAQQSHDARFLRDLDDEESQRQATARLTGIPVRSVQAQVEFERMRASSLQALTVRAEHAASIRANCPAGKDSPPRWQMFCPSSDVLSARDQDTRVNGAMVDSNLAHRLPRRGGSRLAESGWSMGFLGGSVLSHLPYYMPDYNEPAHAVLLEKQQVPEYHSARTPIWNVIVRDDKIMDGHGDIAGSTLVDLLAQLYRSVTLSSFDKTVLERLIALSECQLKQCSAATSND
ncbi:hypothetical protein MW290_09245 [Aquincola tertiaricarbonis]|uniref:Uncharacterized protein n=1 Tax=Aquincola tertiaricarbonis TaxID=391953 RepID=A0ABY4S0S0_AQUTE|nr:hypothetical protein [Aquincola tertiaricarbonis]URI06115.1 hypothetical protein MW290_09245 [Aquincola tertiaricarbonis]